MHAIESDNPRVQWLCTCTVVDAGNSVTQAFPHFLCRVCPANCYSRLWAFPAKESELRTYADWCCFVDLGVRVGSCAETVPGSAAAAKSDGLVGSSRYSTKHQFHPSIHQSVSTVLRTPSDKYFQFDNILFGHQGFVIIVYEILRLSGPVWIRFPAVVLGRL